MKLLAVVGLVAVAFASSHWDLQSENINEKSFHAGKHYTFRFDGQISSGLPLPSSSQQSATRVQSIVSLIFENDRQALLKLQKTRFGSAHRDISESREVQPFGLFEEIEMTKEQQEQLSLPIRFRYEQGLISEIEFDREDQPWSENMKRAVLNMLQVNLSKKSRTDEAEMSRINRDSERSEWPDKETFSTQEMTLEGDCETTYTLVPSGQDSLRVSKSINFNKCAKRVDIRYNFVSDICPSCDKKTHGEEQKVTESSTVLNFELIGDKDEFVIREVELRSQHLFAPLSKEQQLMATVVANKLTLIKVDNQKDSVRAPKSEKKEQLIYSTEWEQALEKFRMTGEESLLAQSPYVWMDKKVEIAKNVVSHLRREMTETQKDKDSFEPEVVRQIARLVEVLRVCTKEEILSIEKEMNKEELLSGLFVDILAQTGTKTSVEVLLRKMVEREVTPVQAVKLLKSLMTLRNPSQPIIESLVRLQKEEIVTRNPAVKQSLWLTIGALMHDQCEHSSNFAQEIAPENNERVCPRRLKEKYVEILESLFDKAETRYEKVLALKTIGNAGFDLVVFHLEKIIRDEREPRTVRIQAIEALRKLRQNMPRKIQSILMPLYRNIREYPEIRVAAFNQIMHTLPERSVIDQITQQLEREPSHQVHSFVYSTLKSLAKSELPCEKTLARDIQISLKLARVQPRKMFDSAFVRGSLYSEEYTTGAALNWAALFSNDSILPKEIMASLDSVFAGNWNKYLAQIGVAQQNLDEILYRIMERIENKEEYSFDYVVVRGKRSTSLKPSEALKQLMKKMNIQQRRSSSEEPHALVYVRVADNDVVVLPIEEDNLIDLIKDSVKGGKIHIGELERVLAKGYRFEAQLATFVYERTRVLATAIGMPVEITGKMPTYFNVEGEIKAELEPKSGKDMKGLRVHLKAQPKLVSTHIMHMEVRSPVHSAGVKILHTVNVNSPIDTSIEINWEKNLDAKLTIRAPQDQEERRVLSLISRPATFVRFEADEKKSQSASEKTVYIGEQPRVEVDRVYGEKIFGLRFNVRGNIHRHMWEKMQQNQNKPILVSENHIEMTMEKTGETPREYVIRMNVASIESEKMISERPQFEQFYEKETESHFEVEDSEYMDEDEKDRRGSFDKYTKEYKKGSGYKNRVHIKAYTVGSSEERKGEMEIKTVCDEELTFCKWTVEAQRSPLLEGERREWTLSAGIQTLFPQPVYTLQQLKEQKHRELTAIVEAKWGSEQKNTLKVRIQGEQSKEQQKWQRLIQNKSEGKKMTESLEKLELASRLNQIKIAAEYEIQPETLVHVERLATILKSYSPILSNVEIRDVRKSYAKEGRLLAKLTVEPQTWRFANVSYETPSERVQLENLRLPFRPTFLSIYKTESPLRQFSPVCEVSSSRINTFDDVIFRAPLTTCYSVLAKDCTEEPRFAVLMKRVEKKGEEKKVKIVTLESTIEIEKKNGNLKVKINGKNVEDEQKLREFGLEKKYDVVIFENEDIFVRFDGYKAEIKMNEFFKNQQCGVCGHFNGERDGEFRRADDVETEDLEEFHRSFLSRDEECDMEEERLSEKKNYKKYSRFENSEEASYDEYDQEYKDESSLKNRLSFEKDQDYEHKENIEPVEKTRVVEYSNRVCFSQQPIPECPRKTYAGEETKEIKAKFSCVDRSSSESRRLLRESRREVLSIDHLPVSFVEPIIVPKTCVVY